MGGMLLALVVVVCALGGVGLLALARRRGTDESDPGNTPTPTTPTTPADRRAALRDAAGATELADGGVALLLFTRASCPRCGDTREVLAAVAAERAGVSHREVDVAARPELVTVLDVRTTPTVVVVDAGGTELLRVAGVPRREDLVAALAPHLS